jgi:hypothetical protein
MRDAAFIFLLTGLLAMVCWLIENQPGLNR